MATDRRVLAELCLATDRLVVDQLGPDAELVLHLAIHGLSHRCVPVDDLRAHLEATDLLGDPAGFLSWADEAGLATCWRNIVKTLFS